MENFAEGVEIITPQTQIPKVKTNPVPKKQTSFGFVESISPQKQVGAIKLLDGVIVKFKIRFSYNQQSAAPLL